MARSQTFEKVRRNMLENGQFRLGWHCDTCGGPILSFEGGMVEWLSEDDEEESGRFKGLRLVHARTASPRWPAPYGCEYNPREEFCKSQSIVEGVSLSAFSAPDGLELLLWMLAQR